MQETANGFCSAASRACRFLPKHIRSSWVTSLFTFRRLGIRLFDYGEVLSVSMTPESEPLSILRKTTIRRSEVL